jgi:hypothetical protein
MREAADSCEAKTGASEGRSTHNAAHNASNDRQQDGRTADATLTPEALRITG